MRVTTSRFIEPKYRLLFWPLLLTFLTFGASMTIIGALLPKILSSFHWSYTAAGAVLASSALGYALSTLTAGMLIQRIGAKLVLVMGLVLLSGSLFFFGALPAVLFNLVFNLLIGIGQGTMETVVNYSLVRMERPGQSHLMSFSHAAFSVGAIGGPTVVALVLARGLPWQTVYHLAAALAMGVALVTALLPFSRIAHAEPEHPSEAGFRKLARYPMFFLAFFVLFIYVGLEIGISNWVSEYYVKVFSTPITTGAFMVSIFWFGIFTGRVLLPVVYRGPRQAESLLVLGALYTLSLLGALLMPSAISAGFFFYLTSLGCSAVYPLVMTLLGRYFERGQSVAVGFASSGGGFGSLVFPLMMSGVAQSLGLRAGFIVYLFMGVLLVVLAYFVVIQMKMRKPV
ncbi:MAG TPA: MFS transporter [Spirochaetia bacterium]|nr:MFS transporter [Spirochaetia bacterium]